MATLQDHARLPAFINGTYLIEVTQIGMRTNSGQLEVVTLEGLVGFSEGAGSVEITLGFAIPIGGTEAEFQEQCAEGSYVTMQIGVGSKSYNGVGKIIDCEIGQSTNSASEGTIRWVGEKKKIQ